MIIRALYDVLEEADLVGSVGIERGVSEKHIVDKETKCQVVNSFVVTLG